MPTVRLARLTSVRFFRRQPRFRPLDERECYLRLHGSRSGQIELVAVRTPASAEVAELLRRRERSDDGAPPLAPGPAAPSGPTDASPALHLLIHYPRRGGRLTGEDVRRELLRRMQARTGQAA
jgi:hypothetical protein